MQQEQLELFNGSDYKPSRDNERLSVQHERIRNLMIDGKGRTLKQIAKETGAPEASVSLNSATSARSVSAGSPWTKST